jgi:hypothetical protein
MGMETDRIPVRSPTGLVSEAPLQVLSSAPLAVLSAATGATLLVIASIVYWQALLSMNNTPVSLGLPPALIAAVFGIGLFLLLLWARRLWPWRRRALALLGDRPGVAAAALALFSLAFLPIGGARLLAYVILSTLGFILLLLGAWPVAARLADFVGARLELRFFGLRGGVFALCVFAGTLALTNLLSLLVFAHTPHIISGITHIFHAKMFLAGKLYLTPHPLSEFFDLHTLVVLDGRWFTHFPPAHTFLMAVGVLAGAPWIVNPVLGSLAVVAFYLLGRELYDEETGRVAAALGMLSPFLLFMSSEYYAHATALLAVSAFILFFAKMVRTGRYGHAVAAAACLGFAFHARPITAAAAALPFGVYELWSMVRTASPRLRRAYSLHIGVTVILCALLLLFNAATTGHWWSFGYSVSVEQRYAEKVSGLTPWLAAVNTVGRLRLLNVVLFGWPLPNTLFVLALFLAGTRNLWDRLLIASALSGVVAHVFWYYPGYEFGPRYYYFATGILALLTTRGMLALPALLSRLRGAELAAAAVRRGVWTTVCAGFIAGIFCVVLPHARLYSSEVWEWRADPQLAAFVERQVQGKAVVFMETVDLFRSVFLHNALDIDQGRIVYARNLGERNALLMRYYPGRRYFLTDGRTLKEIPDEPS